MSVDNGRKNTLCHLKPNECSKLIVKNRDVEIICTFVPKKQAMDYIPKGRTKDDIKAREKLIKDFYAQWISEHPDKKVWNCDMGAFIHVKFLSINETYEKAARDYESTLAVFRLTEILESAVRVCDKTTNRKTRNQNNLKS